MTQVLKLFWTRHTILSHCNALQCIVTHLVLFSISKMDYSRKLFELEYVISWALSLNCIITWGCSSARTYSVPLRTFTNNSAIFWARKLEIFTKNCKKIQFLREKIQKSIVPPWKSIAGVSLGFFAWGECSPSMGGVMGMVEFDWLSITRHLDRGE